MVTAMATAMVMETSKPIRPLEMTPRILSGQLFRRLSIIVATPFLLWHSISLTAANVTREKTPEVALKLRPSDAGALAKRNDFNLVQDAKSGKWRVSVADAQRSLIAEGLNPRAVRQLAFAAENGGDAEKARLLVNQAERMTRRDIGTQLWLANRLASLDNLKGALRHIDLGLRATPESHALLFPLLTQALTTSDFQAEFAPYISTSAPWLGAFINYAFSKPENLDILSQSIVLAGGLRSNAKSDVLNTQMINLLASGGHYSEIQPYYKTWKNPDRSLFSDISLKPSGIDPRNGPLAWSANQNVDIDAAIVAADDGKGYSIDLTIGPGKRRAAAQKILYLQPGTYRFGAVHLFNADAANGAMNWEWACIAGRNTEVLTTHIFRAADVKGASAAQAAVISIPAGCPIQRLTLLAVAGDGAEDTNISVRQLRIMK
jgi:hypothetical protein